MSTRSLWMTSFSPGSNAKFRLVRSQSNPEQQQKEQQRDDENLLQPQPCSSKRSLGSKDGRSSQPQLSSQSNRMSMSSLSPSSSASPSPSASTSRVVRRVLDQIMSHPFAASVILRDAIFLVILIYGFRGAVNRVLLGDDMGLVLKHIYIANTGIFYFVIRELGKAVSLFIITHRARIYFFSFWIVTDMLCTMTSLASTIAIRANFFSRGGDDSGDSSGGSSQVQVEDYSG